MPMKRRVLLVEDEPLIAMLYEDILLETVYDIMAVSMCNDDAINLIQQDQPDIAIVEYNLTDGPCIPIIEELQGRGIPFIVATGYGDNVDPELGSARWLVKPFKDADVISALDEAFVGR